MTAHRRTHFWVILALELFALAHGRRLTLEEALNRVNRLPYALENVLLRATNRVQIEGRAGNNTRIVGGTATSIEDNPFQVAILYWNGQICGGSIISHSWVVTAAHCLDWYPDNADITIRSESTSKSSGETVHPIYYFHIHDQYDPAEYFYDVATIRVRRPFSGLARPIQLTTSEWAEKTPVVVTGWGRNEQGWSPDNLFKVTLTAVDRTTCNEVWKGLITDDMICAGGENVDSCNGDSGGPAVQDGVLYGVVSWGATVCGNGMPGIYTNIAHPSIRGFIKYTTMI